MADNAEKDKKDNSFMMKLATLIVDKRKGFYLIFIVLCIFCVLSMNRVKVNNDLTTYLPDTTETRRGLDLMDSEFTTYGSARILICNVTFDEAQKLADQVETPKSQDNASKNDDAKKEDTSIENGDTSSDQEEQTQNLSVLPEYAELLQQNPEMVGWLSIDDTEINYPVVQKDNTYYLTHGFDQATNSNGSIFMDERCSILKPTINTIIYGHNMKSGMMFGGLKNYLQEGYLDAHKYINFNTIYEKRTYEIVAVGLSKVQYQDEDAYRYYDFITSTSAQDLEDFIQNVDSLAVYGNADGLTLQDKLLTLSTCNSYTEDGRLFVVAKQVQ